MEIDDFINQFMKLKEKELEQKVWEIWIAKLPFMPEEEFISYEEMLNVAKQQETKKEIVTNGIYVDQAFF